MRSADTRKLVVRQTRAVLDARDFAVACAVAWNSLPTDLRVLSLTLPLQYVRAKHLLTSTNLLVSRPV